MCLSTSVILNWKEVRFDSVLSRRRSLGDSDNRIGFPKARGKLRFEFRTEVLASLSINRDLLSIYQSL